jgi:hypothetical protein
MKRGFVICLTLLLSCAGSGKTVSEAAATVQKSESFVSHLESGSLVEKVDTAPSFLIEYLREMDGMPSYEPYEAKKSDLTLFSKYAALLPSVIQETMEDKLIGVYFVKNFKGGGLTDVTWDVNGELYVFLVLNPDILNYDITQWITFRDLTSFVDDQEGYELLVDCGGEYKALLHTLVHEGAHIYDLYNRVTPFTIRGISPDGIKTDSTQFTKGTWAGYRQPLFKYDFKKRSLITAYGLTEPSIPLSQAQYIYSNLEKTPFLSPYASLSWAEDYAETVAWFWLTQVLRQKYEVIITKNKKAVYVWAPCSSVKAKLRFEEIGPAMMKKD